MAMPFSTGKPLHSKLVPKRQDLSYVYGQYPSSAETGIRSVKYTPGAVAVASALSAGVAGTVNSVVSVAPFT